jgi:hypothetical protein
MSISAIMYYSENQPWYQFLLIYDDRIIQSFSFQEQALISFAKGPGTRSNKNYHTIPMAAITKRGSPSKSS